MSILDNGSTGRSGVKTLAIRLEPDLHAQLSLIAQLRGATITDEIKAALEAHIKAAKTLPELSGRAEAVLADIERDATARRAAIATLFGTTEPEPAATAAAAAAAAAEASTGDPEPSAPQPSGSRSRGRRGGSEDAGS
jgi:predicted DNA-binding protein